LPPEDRFVDVMEVSSPTRTTPQLIEILQAIPEKRACHH
jgi:hypothetical protein